MSFILEALKKSEEERLRQQNPSALPTSAPQPSRSTPPWVWIVLGLLAINLAILVALLLKPSTVTDTSIAVAQAATTSIQPRSPEAQGSLVVRAAEITAVERNPTVQTTAALVANIEPRSLASLPTRDQQLAAGANLPAATLNLHVYDADPTKRFVLLNGERLREGDTSRKGLKALSITPEGVVLSYGGASFAVTLEGS